MLKNVIVFVVLVAAGFFLGRLSMSYYKDYQEESKLKELETLIGSPYKKLNEEEETEYRRAFNQAQFLTDRHQFEEALKSIEDMKKVNPWNIECYNFFVKTALDLKTKLSGFVVNEEDAELMKSIEKNLAIAELIDENNLDFLMMHVRYQNHLALAAQEAGKKEVAKKHFAEAMAEINRVISSHGQNDKLFAILSFLKAKIQVNSKEIDKALANIEALIDTGHINDMLSELNYYKAMCYIEKKDEANAYKAFDAALSAADRPQPRILSARAEYHFNNKYYYSAKEDLQILQEMFPNHAEIAEVLKAVNAKIKEEEALELKDTKEQDPS